MAKKFDNDFDAESFVENFRASEGPPTSREMKAVPEANDEAISETQIMPKKERAYTTRVRKEKPSDSADDYQSMFIDDLKYRFPEYGWTQVKIHPDHVAMITTLETLCRNRRANLSTFINNVIEQHFCDYKTQIKEFRNKYNDNE